MRVAWFFVVLLIFGCAIIGDRLDTLNRWRYENAHSL